LKQKIVSRSILTAAAVVGLWSSLRANEIDMLPQAPTMSAPTPVPKLPEPVATPTPTAVPKSPYIAIPSAIPSYVDVGVTMVPMRPLADFLGVTTTYHDSIITLSSSGTTAGGASTPRTITLRNGGNSAQVQQGTERKTIKLPKAAEERLGTVFLPLRFFADVFGAEILPTKGAAILIKQGDRTGEFQSPVVSYSGGDAARVTIVNYVGRAISLRLTGPQNFNIELGHWQSVQRTLKPGIYYFRAASRGMKTVTGQRRLMAGRKATWSWGRKS